MANTVNPILTSNKDGEDTVWAFRISQASSGGSGVSRIVAGTNVTVSPAGGTGVVTVNSSGGGTVTSVTAGTGGVTVTGTSTAPVINIPTAVTSVTAGTGGVTVTGTATAPVINIPAASGVTSLAVSGGGITTSGSSGAVTLTVQDGTKRYAIPEQGIGYYFLGTWVGNVSGSKLLLSIAASQGYNASVGQNQYTDLLFNTSPGGTYFGAGAASYDSWLGQGSGYYAPLAFYLDCAYGVYKVYITLGNYSGTNSFYRIDVGEGTWTPSTTFSTSAPTGNILTITPVAKASVWSQFPATQDVQVAGNFIRGASSIVSFSGLPLTLQPASGQDAIINYVKVASSSPTWGGGVVRSLVYGAGDVSDSKRISWSFDNNPGTNIVDNHSIALTAYNTTITGDTGINGILTMGSGVFRSISGTNIGQPIIQSGTATVSSGSGGTGVSFSPAYISSVPQVIITVHSTNPKITATTSAPTSAGFTIYGSHLVGTIDVDWVSFGT